MISENIEFFEVKEKNVVSSPLSGFFQRFINKKSNFVEPRYIDVWIPPSYLQQPLKKYSVLYVHDGQNLFEPGFSFTNQAWGLDKTLMSLIGEKRVQETIVVGIWNTGKRFREYRPGKPFLNLSQKEKWIKDYLDEYHNGIALGDEYLRYITSEIKPFIDQTFRTLSDKDHTFMMGSSMGAIISIYAISEYPEIFGGAACLSTHYPLILGNNSEIPPIFIQYLKSHLPKAGNHRIYFDYGTETYDSWYEPYQKMMDSVMNSLGYLNGLDWVTMKFEGAEHSETAWRSRLDIPLLFLLNNEN